MTTIRFRYDTDATYDRGTIHEFDDAIADLYIQRGVAETPMNAAIRIALEHHDAKQKENTRTPELAAELSDVAGRLNPEQKAQLDRVICSLDGGTMEKREDKMMRTAKHKTV